MRLSKPPPSPHTFTSFASVSHSVPSKSALSSAVAAVRRRRSPAAQPSAPLQPPSLPSQLAHSPASLLSRLYAGSDDARSEAGSSAYSRGGGDEYYEAEEGQEEEEDTPSPSLDSLARATSAGGSERLYRGSIHSSRGSAVSVSSTGSNASASPSDSSPLATPSCSVTPLASSVLSATTAADFAPAAAQQPQLPFRPARSRSHSRIRQRVPLRLPAVPDRLHHFTLYETRQRWYVVGSNLTRTQHRLLKLGRSSLTALSVDEDYTVYSASELDSLLHMIHTGNAASGGILSVRRCPAIIGFVRFLFGYYLYVVTSASEVGRLGAHIVYAVSGAELLPVAGSSVWEASGAYKRSKAVEGKYKALFLSMDVSRYFYFSHTYQLTRTLQLNMVAGGEDRTSGAEKDMYVWNHCMRLKQLPPVSSSPTPQPADPLSMELDRSDWCIHLLHGYFEQSTLSVLGRPLTLTLIARRSRHYAGTRYLKRGINSRGQAANDVETEQILHDRSQGSARDGAYTAYVTMRASIPVHWSQESNAIVAQPAIVMQKLDPLHLSTRRHVEDVWRRYGSPLLVLNLVKQTEARKRESIIGAAFGEAVEWLNVWLEEQHRVDYHAWDFKKISKSSSLSLMDELTVIAHWALQRTGLFHSHPKSDAQRVRAADTIGLKPTRESLREWGVDGLPARKADKKRRADGVSGQKEREAQLWERSPDGASGSEERSGVQVAVTAAELSGAHSPMSAPFALSSIRQDGSRTDHSPFPRSAHTAHSAHARSSSDDSAGFSLSSLAALSPSPSHNPSLSSDNPSSPSLTRAMRNVAFLQRGVCRGNCVDSLDRTNAALYCLGKCALGYQLHALSLLPSPVADNFGAIGSVLLDMYERMGDAIALQYGGSQMHRQVRKDQTNTHPPHHPPAHSREQKSSKTVPVLFSSLSLKTSHKPAELLTSIVRHYHNSFQDVSKQDAINLFLGLYHPWERGKQGELWDLASDYYLHNSSEEVEEEERRLLQAGQVECKQQQQEAAEEEELNGEEDGDEEEYDEDDEEEEEEEEDEEQSPKAHSAAQAKHKRMTPCSERLVRYEDERWWKQPIEENEKLLGPLALPSDQLFSSRQPAGLSATTPLTTAALLGNNQYFQRSVSSPVRMLHQSVTNALAIPPFSSSTLLPSSSTASTLPAVPSSLSDSSTLSRGADSPPLSPSLSWVLSYGPLTALTEFDALLAAQAQKGNTHSITILGVDNDTAQKQRASSDNSAKQVEASKAATQQSDGKRKSRRREKYSLPLPSPVSPARAEWEALQSAAREAYEQRRLALVYSLDSGYALCRASPVVPGEVAAAYERYVKQGVQSFLVPESSVHDSEWMVGEWRKAKQEAKEAVKRRAREKAYEKRQKTERQTAALERSYSPLASTIVKDSIGTAGVALATRKVSLVESGEGQVDAMPRLTSFVVVTGDRPSDARDDDDDDDAAEHLLHTAPARMHALSPPYGSGQSQPRAERQHSLDEAEQRQRGPEPLLSPLSTSSVAPTSFLEEPSSPAVDDVTAASSELSLPLTPTQLSLFRIYVSYCTSHLQPALWRGCFAAHMLHNKSIDHTHLQSVFSREYRDEEQDMYRKYLSLS